jgi:galactonate dehydratase
MLLKIETDEGVVGWGEPVIEGRARTVETAVQEMEPYLIGQDPSRINDLWQTMYRAGFYRGGAILMSAIAGIDQALWDIKGKVLGKPVYELLGGLVRDRMKMYSWVGGDRPSDIIEQIRTLQKGGFNTFKMNGTEELGMLDTSAKVDEAVRRVAEIREAFGTTIEFGLDFHGRVAAPMAKTLLRELEQFRPLFVEEPVLAEQAEYYPRLAEMTSIPLAAGERMYSRFEFKNVFAAGGLSIVQPDLSHAGGITECLKIASMAEAYDITLAPHCPLGPVALASCLQWTSCRTTPCCRSRAWASTTTRAASCSTTSSTRKTSRSSTATASRCRSLAWAWKWTKASSKRARTRLTGATRSGATKTAASRSGK